MPLVVTFLALLVGLTAVFLGLSLTLQRLFYNQPAGQLPLRSLVAALLMAVFLTAWTFVNTRASHKDKYGALHEANSTAQSTTDDFQAVRRLSLKSGGQYKEETVPFVMSVDGKGFVEKDSLKPFRRNTSDYVTTALVVPRDGKPVKFVADVKDLTYVGVKASGDPVFFKAESGTGTISDQNLRVVETFSYAGLVVVLVINALHFALWLVAFWPLLNFRVGLSLLLATVFGAITMLVLMPLLFNSNAVKPAATAPPQANVSPTR